jgi:serine/threonine protein kinase
MRSQQRVLYGLADPEHYDAIDRYRPDVRQYIEAVRQLLPAGWRMQRAGPWCQCSPPDSRLPSQGWKIHLSARLEDARKVLLAVVPVLVEHGTAFKLGIDARILQLMNGKRWSRARSGKFVTIYPAGHGEFLALLPALHAATAAFAGPYILSDRRYADSRVVHYRYGTIQGSPRVDVTGQQVGYLTGPDGSRTVDLRQPYFHVPWWTRDPFDSEGGTPESVTQEPKSAGAPPQESIGLQRGRYRVTSVLGFTNGGGIYLADDAVMSRTVVLKEARPHVGEWPPAGDAVAMLTREFGMLRAIADLGVGPAPYDLFTEWEHTFLAEEYVPGQTLRMHAVKWFPLFRRDPPRGEVDAFRANTTIVFERLADAIAQLHARRVVFADLSPANVLVLDESLELRLIDFEAAFVEGQGPAVDLVTPGFAPRRRDAGEAPSRERDLFSLGAVMLAYLFPVASYFELEPSSRRAWLTTLARDLGLPAEIPACIDALMQPEPAARPSAAQIAQRIRRLSGRRSTTVWPAREAVASTSDPGPPADAATLARRAAEYIDSVADPSRRDRLWPADPFVFHTNPLSVAYGACGIAAALHRITGACPAYAREWIARQPLSTDAYPAGLYIGLSGIAWTLLDIGQREHAERAMALAAGHPLLWESPDLFYGAAGWGMTNLKFFLATGDDIYLQRARAAGERILRSGEPDGDALSWRSIDRVYLGLAHGASGIGLFLLYLAVACREERWLDAARRALAFDLDRAVAGRLGGLAWPYHTEQPNPILPYWKYGSAGVGSALLRFQRVAPTPRWQTALEGIADFVDSKYAVGAGQTMGLAGIGNFLIDAHQFTGNHDYLSRAASTFEGIRLFATWREGGVAFPGDTLERISCDYATGTAGVALFLWRLVHGGGAAFMLDELFT